MLLDAQPDMEVVGEASDGAEAVERALELDPDVVLMDITMKGMNGLTATRRLKDLNPDTKVLVLTMHDDQEYLREMLRAGATGYVLKRAADSELVVAIRAAQRGEVFVYPSLATVLLRDLGRMGKVHETLRETDVEALSEREREVLRQVALGYTNQQIASQLFLSAKTIETYRARLMKKLDLENRAALVRYALRRGLLDDEGEAVG
jgi:two-component system response regulator NreC